MYIKDKFPSENIFAHNRITLTNIINL